MSEKTTVRVVYDPLTELMSYYAGQKGEKKERATKAGPVEERLKNRIIDGDKVGMQADLDEGLKKYSALDIINNILLDGMKIVGDLFGSGQMQLPFVLQSAEVMKSAVAYLEQFMDKASTTSKGTMVIATVKGDVHDIGKNLVDIILTNNGYKVHNLGIKCPVDAMLHAAEENNADAIGMSGLLVKSTLIMKENLEVMNERGIMIPVVLGGAALTRRYVEQDLRSIYRGSVAYANDAFDGLHFMEELADVKRQPDKGKQAAGTNIPSQRELETSDTDGELSGMEAKIAMSPKLAVNFDRQTTVSSAPIPHPPFYGTKIVEEVSLDEIFRYVNEVALIRGQWQVRKGKLSEGEYSTLLTSKIYPALRQLQQKIISEELLSPKVVYGYFPCQSEGDNLIIYRPNNVADPVLMWGSSEEPQSSNLVEWVRFTFPRQTKGRFFCISDFFASKDSHRIDVVSFHLVTMGRVASEHSQRLFASNNYQEYLYFHGLSVESAEALAELWHRKIREELNIHEHDAQEIKKLFSQQYQGSRYSFGYPACPSLEDQKKLFDLLRPGRIEVELTEEFQLVPEQSTSAIIVHHPEARYFNI